VIVARAPARLRSITLGGTALALLALAAVAGCGSRAIQPPVIHESFTPLPCPMHRAPSLAMEGCYEKAIAATDRKIDMDAKAIFKLLASHTARLVFVEGEQSWLRYRHDSCAAEASKYAGGTFAPVFAATCILDRSKEHLRELLAMRKALSFH
jgi:uncharacterized protein YecT (DUF1311 family)